jgi:ABC-type multidrug transport system permease subunit
MPIRALVKKEFRLLLRDRLSAGILIGMPLLFILLLGLLLGEGFGQKPDDRLRVSLVSEDLGYRPRQAASLFMATNMPGSPLGAVATYHTLIDNFEDWSKVVQRDLSETAGIRVELIESREEAERLVHNGRRSAVLAFGPLFTEQVHNCSFVNEGTDPKLLPLFAAAGGYVAPLYSRDALNPFYRDGVDLAKLDASFLLDPTQVSSSAIIEQVGQVSLLRVILPWMIGKAFDRLSDPLFIDRLGKEVNLPVPPVMQPLMRRDKVTLQQMLDLAAGPDRKVATDYRQKVGTGVKRALQGQFSKYNLTGKSWGSLTQSQEHTHPGAETERFRDEGGAGWLKRGAARYQILVPAYTVMFSFALLLPVGWLFVMERRQGTLKRLRAAPVTRQQVLVGTLLPCLCVSIVQGVFLLLAGKLLFGMSWGPESWSLGQQALMLLPVLVATSLAAMGLALLLAALARTEIQVALIGSLLVLFLGLLSGCLIPRELMPETMVQVSYWTPHAWALDAYRQLLLRPTPGADITPNLQIVMRSCLVLAGYGAAFLGLAWAVLRLE